MSYSFTNKEMWEYTAQIKAQAEEQARLDVAFDEQSDLAEKSAQDILGKKQNYPGAMTSLIATYNEAYLIATYNEAYSQTRPVFERRQEKARKMVTKQ